jgi:TctA family transporter
MIHLTILFTSAALGIFCILSGTRRIQLMGALILPTIIYYLFN